MNFMAGSSSSLGLASHFNPKRGGTKAQQTVIWAMKLAKEWIYLFGKKGRFCQKFSADAGEGWLRNVNPII